MKKIWISENFPNDRLAAAKVYHQELGWAIHALFGPKEGNGNSSGKQPVSKGWTQWTVEQVTDKYLQEQFGNGRAHNVGCVVRPPHVVVDLDSKPDKGVSVREWLDQQPEIQNVPNEQ